MEAGVLDQRKWIKQLCLFLRKHFNEYDWPELWAQHYGWHPEAQAHFRKRVAELRVGPLGTRKPPMPWMVEKARKEAREAHDEAIFAEWGKPPPVDRRDRKLWERKRIAAERKSAKEDQKDRRYEPLPF